MTVKAGGFSQSGDTYTFNSPDLPKPINNWLFNKKLLSQVNQAAGGNLRVKSEDGSITELLSGETSRLLYVRDNVSEKFWCPTWLPAKKTPDNYQVDVLTNETVIKSVNENIATSLIISPSSVGPFEIWHMSFLNEDTVNRKLSLFVAAKITATSPEYLDCYSYKNVTLIRDRKSGIITFVKLSTEATESFTWKEELLKRYDGYDKPTAVVEGHIVKSKYLHTEVLPGFHKKITLGVGQKLELSFFVGTVPENEKDFLEAKSSYFQAVETLTTGYIKDCRKALDLSHEETLRSLDTCKISTPEETFDRYCNYFLPFQLTLNTAWPKECNALTIKDICYSIVSATRYAPEVAEARILDLFSHQFKEGYIALDLANQSESVLGSDDMPLDTLLSLEAVITYVTTTGNKEILEKTVPYGDGGVAKVLDHLLRGVNYVLENVSENLLIRAGNLESTSLTARFIKLLSDIRPLLQAQDEKALLKKYQDYCLSAGKYIEKRLWLGSWYSRGLVNGKAINPELSIHGRDLSAQIWPIIAGLLDKKKAKGLIERLAKETAATGPLNFSKPYVAYDNAEKLSYNKTGQGHNSVLELETAIYFIKAAAMVGAGETAWRLVTQICPSFLSSNPERFLSEPFWLPVTIDGPTSELPGQGHSQVNAPAGLFHQVVLEDILGVKPTLDGLIIEPCFPKGWRQVEVSTGYAGAHYHIVIQNPFRSGQGVDRLLVDGIRLTGNTIRPFASGLHYVEVILG